MEHREKPRFLRTVAVAVGRFKTEDGMIYTRRCDGDFGEFEYSDVFSEMTADPGKTHLDDGTDGSRCWCEVDIDVSRNYQVAGQMAEATVKQLVSHYPQGEELYDHCTDWQELEFIDLVTIVYDPDDYTLCGEWHCAIEDCNADDYARFAYEQIFKQVRENGTPNITPWIQAVTARALIEYDSDGSSKMADLRQVSGWLV